MKVNFNHLFHISKHQEYRNDNKAAKNKKRQ